MVQMQKVSGVATKVIRQPGLLIVRYHSTDVVIVDRGEITLNTGGWKTATTKNRMNQAAAEFRLNYRVYQMNGNWYVLWNGVEYPFTGDSITLNG